MAVGYLFLAIWLAVTTSLTSSQGNNNSIRAGITVVPDVARVIAQKSAPLLLNCSVILDSNVGEVSYSWLKNGKPLPRLDSNRQQLFQNGSLYFKRVVHKTGRRRKKPRSDQGVYECLAGTQHGQAIIRRVFVQVASISKKFSQDPAPAQAYEGGVARFQCRITATPPPIILWKRVTPGSQDEHLDTNLSKYVQLPQGVLHIRDVRREDAGEYRCVASRGGLIHLPDVIDKIEWADSQPASLTVLPGRSRGVKVLAAPQNLSLDIHGTGAMECLVDGSPPPAVSWSRKGGSAIEASHLVEPGVLTFTDVAEEDAGEYVCTVQGHGIVRSASLSVNKPPVVVKGPTSQQWAMTRTVRFDCEVDGTPKPAVSWYHNGDKITNGMAKVTIKPKQLILQNTGENDSGYYQCIAENPAGNVILVARLYVYLKDGMPSTPENLTGVAVSSTSIHLQWYQPQQPDGEPILTSTIWFAGDASSLNSKFVNGKGPNCSFTLTGLEPNTVYTIFIRSFNKVSPSASSQSISVQTLEEVPMAAPKLRLSSPSPDQLQVSWDPLTREESRGVIVGYRVFYKQMPHGPQSLAASLPANQTEYVLQLLEPETEYGVRVEAGTKIGYRNFDPEPSDWTVMKTSNKLGRVRDVVVVPVNSSAVRLSWQPGTGEEDVATYSVELFAHYSSGEVLSLRTMEVAAPRTHLVLTGLDNTTQFSVSIVAKSGQHASKQARVDFKTSALPPPVDLRGERLSPSSLRVAWQQPPGIQASTFSVCYRIIQLHAVAGPQSGAPASASSSSAAVSASSSATPHWTCFESHLLNATVTNLQPFTRYYFSIIAQAGNLRSPKSEFLDIQTLEDVPSPPEKISWNLVSRGTIELQWQPPTSPNGVITSYIILYNPDQLVPETTWKNITQTGQLTKAQVGDLTATVYYFKLRACTRAGKGSPSPVVVVNPDCPAAQHPCQDNKASLYGLVSGVVIGLILLVACLVGFCYCIRRSRACNESEAPHYHGNGHAVGANGHARSVEVGSRLAIALQDFDSMAPMLTKLPENEQSDAKGGGNMIVTPNGVKVNGLLKCYQNGQIPNGHLTHYPASLPPYCDNHEETHRLIDLMLASTDGSLTGEGSDCAGASSILTTERDSLEDIDRSHDDNHGEDDFPHHPQLHPNGVRRPGEEDDEEEEEEEEEEEDGRRSSSSSSRRRRRSKKEDAEDAGRIGGPPPPPPPPPPAALWHSPSSNSSTSVSSGAATSTPTSRQNGSAVMAASRGGDSSASTSTLNGRNPSLTQSEPSRGQQQQEEKKQQQQQKKKKEGKDSPRGAVVDEDDAPKGSSSSSSSSSSGRQRRRRGGGRREEEEVVGVLGEMAHSNSESTTSTTSPQGVEDEDAASAATTSVMDSKDDPHHPLSAGEIGGGVVCGGGWSESGSSSSSSSGGGGGGRNKTAGRKQASSRATPAIAGGEEPTTVVVPQAKVQNGSAGKSSRAKKGGEESVKV